MKIKIGTRGSNLALAQTNLVVNELNNIMPTSHIDINIIKTKGDMILDKSLDKIGGKGLFVKEIEEQLLLKKINIAGHSMKDLPTENLDEFLIIPILERETPLDYLVTKHKINSCEELKS
ncbi:MAG: hydroxymethylbilane synthase, partial [Lachnospirales bacterium]